jgi:hypothetical protein
MQYHGKYLEYDRKLLLLIAEQLPVYDRSLIEDFIATDLQRESLVHAWAADTCRCRGGRTQERLEQLFEWVNFEQGGRAVILRHLGEPDFARDEIALGDAAGNEGISIGYYLQPSGNRYGAELQAVRCNVTFTIWSRKEGVTTKFVCTEE